MCRQGSMLYMCVGACAEWMGMLNARAHSYKVTEGMEREAELWRCSTLILSIFSSLHPPITLSSLSVFLSVDWGGPSALFAASLSQLQQHHQVRVLLNSLIPTEQGQGWWLDSATSPPLTLGSFWKSWHHSHTNSYSHTFKFTIVGSFCNWRHQARAVFF